MKHILETPNYELLIPNSRFIATEPLGKAGEAGEQKVWEVVQTAFAQRDCIGYWRYPIFSSVDQGRKEPDILIADRELGLIVIEVKSLSIEQIVAINGHHWQYRNFYTATGNPYQQAENQLLSLLEYSDREPSLRRQVTGRALVALPYITEQQWQQRGFDQLPCSPPLIFAHHLTPQNLLETLQQTSPLISGHSLTSSQWNLLLTVLSGTSLFRQPSHRVLAPPQSRGKVLQKMRQTLSQLDWQQERMSKQIPPGCQRIRGIAGSGKTVLLCQKAAQMHLKYPQWSIAIVFFSRSLYDPIQAQVDRWLRYFSKDRQGYDPKNGNLKILHGWGAKQQPGLYSTLCWQARVPMLTVKDTFHRQPNESLAEACVHLLKAAPIPQCFDAILIDEGQDFIVDEWTFEGKQPFYWLAYQALRPVNSSHPEQRRLIWAYDEVQSLESLKIPTASELLGEDLGHLVTGTYGNGIRKTEVMPRCYRTPHQILTVAHGIGMGLLRDGGMLTGMTSEEDWEAIGYKVTSDSSGKITLNRPRKNSPNPMADLWKGSCLEFKIYRDRTRELQAIADQIKQNLRHDGLRPSQEILVLVLGSLFEAKKLETQVAHFLLKQAIDIYIPSTPTRNVLDETKRNCNPNQFWCEGAVTVSRIHRAKGNEADMVYIVGLDRVAQDESNLSLRNQLFVALTRARGWVYLSGIGHYPFYDELDRVIRSGDTFTVFQTSTPKRELTITDAGELLKRYSLGGRNFQNVDLQNAEFPNSYLSNINLIGANLQGVNLQNANLDQAKLILADLTTANFQGASLRKAKLMGATLKDTNFTNADLSYADLRNTDLTSANLQGACLTGILKGD